MKGIPKFSCKIVQVMGTGGSFLLFCLLCQVENADGATAAGAVAQKIPDGQRDVSAQPGAAGPVVVRHQAIDQGVLRLNGAVYRGLVSIAPQVSPAS